MGAGTGGGTGGLVFTFDLTERSPLWITLLGPYDWEKEAPDFEPPSGEPVSTEPPHDDPFLEELFEAISRPLTEFEVEVIYPWTVNHGLDGHCCFSGHDMMNCGCCKRHPAIGCQSARGGRCVVELLGAQTELAR